MACGEFGPGRLPDPQAIMAEITHRLDENRAAELPGKNELGPNPLDGQPAFAPDQHRPLHGKHVLVTAGPTHEPIDPVRYIANRSSGRQGFAIAAAAAEGHLGMVKRPPRPHKIPAPRPGENEFVKVIGGAEKPIVSFAQFRDLCYELGCNATAKDYADAGSAEGQPVLTLSMFVEWMRGSRLAQFVLRSGRKRQGIAQAISYFQFFDKNRDGTVDATEWPDLHADLRSHYPWLADDPTECLKQLDANGDGVVELEEYLAWCLKGSARDSEPDVVASNDPAGGDGSVPLRPVAPDAPVPAPRSPKASPRLIRPPKPTPRSPKASPRASPRVPRRGGGDYNDNTV